MSYHCPNFAIEKIEYQMKNVNHIVWADLIRVIAILMVICIHCSDPFNVSPEARLNPEYNLWGSIYGAFLRPCVPLFVMLTGMLLLPVEQEIGQFYKKRMLRVIVPFIVWSLLYNLFPWFTGILGLNNYILYLEPHNNQKQSEISKRKSLITNTFYKLTLFGCFLSLPKFPHIFDTYF